MFIYEDFDTSQTRDYVWTDEERAAERAADRAQDEAAGREYIIYPRYIDPDAVPYKGMLDDVLPEANVRLMAHVNHYIQRTDQHPSGLSELFEVSTQFTVPTTLRDGLLALEKAQEQSAEEQDGEPRNFFIEGAQLHRDEDGTLVLLFGLGT